MLNLPTVYQGCLLQIPAAVMLHIQIQVYSPLQQASLGSYCGARKAIAPCKKLFLERHNSKNTAALLWHTTYIVEVRKGVLKKAEIMAKAMGPISHNDIHCPQKIALV